MALFLLFEFYFPFSFSCTGSRAAFKLLPMQILTSENSGYARS